MLLRAAFALLVAAFAPAALQALAGGSDLDVGEVFRVSFFDAGPFTVGLGTAFAASLLDVRHRRLPRLFLIAALVALGVLAFVTWNGAIRETWLRVTNPWMPALEGAGLVLLAVLSGARPAAPLRRTLLAPCGALAAGVVALAVLAAADARHMERRVAAPRPAVAGPDVIFVLVDTLRADALGIYGARPSPSPWIDARAERSVVFRRAVSQAAWTYASVSSFMTSRQPATLKLHDRLVKGGATMPSLDAGVPRLVAWLRDFGWHTASFYTNPFLSPGSGLEVGFDVHEFVGGPGRDVSTAGWVVDETFRWGRMLAAERARGDRNPYFLYLHFMEPHLDYRPPSEFWSEEARAYDGPLDGSSRRLHKKIRSKTPFTAEDLAFLHAVYRGEVAFLDSQLRRLEEGLRALGLWSDETIFVLTADHGEQIGEHGEFEHGDVHVENVHVPLVIGVPGAPPHAVDQVVRLLDLAPTLLELLEAPPLPGAQGRSLVPLLFGGSLPAVASLTEHGERRRLTTETLSLVVDHGETHLYDWTADPDEERDLAAARPAETAALLQALEEERRRFAAGSVPQAPARALDPETLEQLRALGYL